MSEIINAQDVLQLLLRNQTHLRAFLDVRSEGEWAEAAIPGFVNGPILSNSERHEVGICYKASGQQAAMSLGFALTAPFKSQRVANWVALTTIAPTVVACWRGGLRSRLACEWLAEAGVSTMRVRGGYKALRAVLRESLQESRSLLVLSGATGTGKTTLLRQLPVAKVDLEACANHRGSAFGRLGDQPSQQTFENRVAMALLQPAREYVVEDESRLIGVNEVPATVKRAMYAAPVVVLELAMVERVELTYREYVLEPLKKGLDPEVLRQQLQAALDRIARKLGVLRHAQLSEKLADAMREPLSVDRHGTWIEPLLADYYDPRYQHAFNGQPRQILFRGDCHGCREFLIQRQAAIA